MIHLLSLPLPPWCLNYKHLSPCPSTLGIWATYQEPHSQNKLTYSSLPGAINLQQLLHLGRVWCQAWVQYKFAIWPLWCIYLLVWQMVMKKEIRWKVLLIFNMCQYIHTVHRCEHIQIIHFVSPMRMALVLLALVPWHQTQVLENNIENRWLCWKNKKKKSRHEECEDGCTCQSSKVISLYFIIICQT